jgi:hypothetical protein
MNHQPCTVRKDHRTSDRSPVQHVIPSCLVAASTGRRLSGILVDISHSGLRLNTTTPLDPGTRLSLLTLDGAVDLVVVWQGARGTRGVWAHGLAVADKTVDLAARFSTFLQ